MRCPSAPSLSVLGGGSLLGPAAATLPPKVNVPTHPRDDGGPRLVRPAAAGVTADAAAVDPVAVQLIDDYADTWRLLAAYDENRLGVASRPRPSRTALTSEAANRAVVDFKRELIARGEASPLFGRARNDALDGILGAVEQTMFGEPLYRSPEEKAAHLLCFIVKDRPFSDGNKRIASLLFLVYLKAEGVAHQITPRALAPLTLLIAESAPASKDQMVRLVVNLLVER